MRLFEIEPSGYSPLHQHNWEHKIFVIEGNGLANNGKDKIYFKEGDVIFIPPMEWHQLINNGSKTLKFLCLIPYEK